MSNTYKVGENSQYGTLLAEAVKADNSLQILSLYANLDNSGYKVIEWTIGDGTNNWPEIETFRTIYDNLDEARQNWLNQAFGIKL